MKSPFLFLVAAVLLLTGCNQPAETDSVSGGGGTIEAINHAKAAGIPIIVAINKMDLVSFDASTFRKITEAFEEFAKPLGFETITAIPICALKGDNITERSAHTSWYQGPTLMGCLETLPIQEPTHNKAVFPVQWGNRPNANFRGFSGTLSTGQLAVGDTLRITASGQTATLARIVTADGDLPVAQAGDAITLVLDREVDASRGDVIALAADPLQDINAVMDVRFVMKDGVIYKQ